MKIKTLESDKIITHQREEMSAVNSGLEQIPTPKISLQQQVTAKVINGAVAGVVGTVCVFPLDLSKTRLQEQTKAVSKSSVHYRNVFDCIYKVAKFEGFRNLYKGLPISLLFVMPEKTLKLTVNDQMRYSFGSRNGSILPLSKELIAGASAGASQVIVTTPMELLKIQLQMANKNKAANESSPSAFKLASNIIRREGISVLYRGLGATLLRDVPFSLLYFPGFAYLNNMGFGENGEKPMFYHTLAAGLISGCIAAFAVTPCDVIKTRLQFLGNNDRQVKYTGIIDCAKKTYLHDGASAFLKGAVPRMIVMAPLFGIAQVVYFLGIGETVMGLKQY